LAELVEMFVAELPDRITAIEKASRDHDLAKLGTLAHQLKGAAGGYGFSSITESAMHVEHGTKTHENAAALDSQVGELVALCRRTTAYARTG